MKKLLVFLLIFSFCYGAQAQLRRKKGSPFRTSRYEPLYKWQGQYKRMGIHFSLGPTYTMTRIGEEKIESGSDTITRLLRDPKGHLGYFVEVGMVHIPKKKQKVLSYWDWALGVKHFGGQERITHTQIVNSTESDMGERFGKWFNGYAFARMNLHNVVQVSNYDFLDNSLGFNVDYRVYGKSDQSGAAPLEQHFQNNLKISLNYALGWGFKMRNGFFIMPQVRIPILTAFEWDKARPSIRWFSSRFMPIMVTVKFAWLFKKNPNDCPPVYKHDSDNDKDEQFRQGGGL